MSRMTVSATASNPASLCFRLTPQGRACVDMVETGQQTIGSLSRYLHDVLLMCGSGMWFEQLRQFMPPRSLEQSLQSLLLLGLIEVVEPAYAPRYEAPPRSRGRTAATFTASTAA